MHRIVEAELTISLVYTWINNCCCCAGISCKYYTVNCC